MTERTAVYIHVLGLIAEAGYLKYGIRRYGNCIITIDIRNSVGTATEHDRSHYRTSCVFDGSLDCHVLGECSNSRHQAG